MVIGITGGYCTGKTTVAKIFRKFGARVIDLDKLAHKALNPKAKSFKKIAKEFGGDILVGNRIDRLLLGQKVFGNKKKLAKLNSIIHPVVIKEMASLIRGLNKSCKLIVVEAPLLFEAGLKAYFDYVVVVKINKETQIKRAIKATGLIKADVQRRIDSQLAISKKIAQADFIIDNNNSIGETRKQVKKIIERFKEVDSAKS